MPVYNTSSISRGEALGEFLAKADLKSISKVTLAMSIRKIIGCDLITAHSVAIGVLALVGR